MLQPLFILDKKYEVSGIISVLLSFLIALSVLALFFSLYSVIVSWNSTTCFYVDSDTSHTLEQFQLCQNGLISIVKSELSVTQGKVGPITYSFADHNPLQSFNSIKWLLVVLIPTLTGGIYFVLRRRIRPIHTSISTIVLMMAFFFWMYFKGAVIDVDVMAFSGDYATTGANPYELASIQGGLGLLPTFPYLPPCLILFSALSYIRQFIELIGIPVRSYSVLSCFIGLSYFWLCLCLAKILSKTPYDLGVKKNFYFFFLNPLGLYYVAILTQLDIVAVSLFVYAMLLLVESKKCWVLVLVASLMLFKLQHLPIIFVSLFAVTIFNVKLVVAKQTLQCIFVSIVFALIIFLLYRFWPSLLDSLSLNPQAKRIDWSVWWSYFQSLLIYRPVGFALIAFLLIVLGLPDFNKTSLIDTSLACIFSVGIFTSLYQASFAHTFGMTAFIFPASCCLAVFYVKQNFIKLIFWYIFSISLVCTWGVGIVGQGNILTAFDFYPAFSVPEKMANWLFTVEYVSHLCYGFLLTYLLRYWSYISKQ